MPESIQAKYKSPLRKVLKLLASGRANWKAKYLATKEKNKYLQNKLRRLEQSQQEWKRKAQATANEIEALQRAIANPDPPEAVEGKKNGVIGPAGYLE